ERQRSFQRRPTVRVTQAGGGPPGESGRVAPAQRAGVLVPAGGVTREKRAEAEPVAEPPSAPRSPALRLVVHDRVRFVQDREARARDPVEEIDVLRRTARRPRPQSLVESADGLEDASAQREVAAGADVP